MSLLDTASLIVTPNGYKEGKLYSVIPSDGSGDMSVVRATTATRVNSAGLVELVPYNLLSWSEDFSATRGFFASVIGGSTAFYTGNYAAAPDGTMTADRIQLALNGQPYADWVNPITLPLTIGNTYTYSIYLKSLAGSTSLIILNDGAADIAPTTINNQWVRYEYTWTATSTTIYPRFLLISITSSTADVLAWGYQLNEGTIKPYQKTETRLNIPRLDYSNGTCPSLLVEPQRTNIALYSEDIAQSIPTFGGGSVTANNTIAPSGILNADKFTIDTSNSVHYFYKQYASVNGQSYTSSIFLKAGTGRYFLYRIITNGTAWRYGVTIDLETGTILSQNSMGTPTGTSSKIEDYGNGWYRVSLSINSFGTEIATLLETSNTGTPSLDANIDYFYTGNGTDSYYIWGNQLEAGSYATSYIPTTSASVTRNADVISKTGISSLIGQTEGTIFIDVENNETEQSCIISTNAGSGSGSHIYLGQNNNNLALYIRDGFTYSIAAENIANIIGRKKIALAYGASFARIYMNGTQIYNSTSAVIPSGLDRIEINNFVSTSIGCAKINAVAFWETKLDNATLAQLTTI